MEDTTAYNNNKCRIIVDNLPGGISSKDLESLFREAGSIRNATVFRRRNGTSSGEIVFVRYIDASLAIMKFNNKKLQGSPVKVSYAMDRKKSSNSEIKDLRNILNEKRSRPLKRRFEEDEEEKEAPKKMRLEKRRFEINGRHFRQSFNARYSRIF